MKHQGPFSGIINYCIDHPVLANLMMVVALITGLASVYQMNRQSLPDFNIETAVVTVAWPGASSEEVQGNITQPLENELFGLKGLVNIRATASAGSGVLVMEFITGTIWASSFKKFETGLPW